MQTITTKYLAPTNTKGSRIKATHTSKVQSVTMGYNYALDTYQNHLIAAEVLQDKLWWNEYTLHAGETDTGYDFVLSQGDTQ